MLPWFPFAAGVVVGAVALRWLKQPKKPAEAPADEQAPAPDAEAADPAPAAAESTEPGTAAPGRAAATRRPRRGAAADGGMDEPA